MDYELIEPDRYFIYDKSHKAFIEVKGSKVDIPEWSEFDLFAHHPFLPPVATEVSQYYYQISEGITGAYFSDFVYSVDEAISSLKGRLARLNINAEDLRNAIDKNVQYYGISPRYRQITVSKPITTHEKEHDNGPTNFHPSIPGHAPGRETIRPGQMDGPLSRP